jgi:carboxylate-amine ligase
MRYSFDEKFLDMAKGELVDFRILLDELFELVWEDADALRCIPEVTHAKTILERGTSAHRQIGVYNGARARGASDREALRAVVDFLIAETAAGTH